MLTRSGVENSVSPALFRARDRPGSDDIDVCARPEPVTTAPLQRLSHQPHSAARALEVARQSHHVALRRGVFRDPLCVVLGAGVAAEGAHKVVALIPKLDLVAALGCYSVMS